MVTRRHSPEVVSLWLALYAAAVLNYPFWRLFFKTVAPATAFEWLFAAAMFAVLFLAIHLAQTLIAFPRIFKAAIAVLLPVTAAASYFMLEYGTVIDVDMVRNVVETNAAEAQDLISPKLMVYVGFLGILPAIALGRLPINWRPVSAEMRSKFKTAAISLPLMAAIAFPFWPEFASVFREHRELRLTLLPSNYLSALAKYVLPAGEKASGPLQAFGTDAKQQHPAGPERRKTLFVIVVGETARADHFSLNGYRRDTNPELAKIDDLINYPKAYSCGTDTAQSVPCMFSGLGRAGFSNAAAASRENLLDILAKAGVRVHWDDNQTGCKGVCKRVEIDDLTHAEAPEYHSAGENHDELLVDDLKKEFTGMLGDTVIVLHMMGSHGPAYWKRVPEKFEVFKPICKESQFSRCDLASIVNAYDNTILYTDFVLSRVIRSLEELDGQGVDAGLIYVSDHGESLGENNLYLHGMPYAIAPEAQKHIPMLTWLSKGFKDSRSLDATCMKAASGGEKSHDNLFHSVLGAMDIATSVYDPALDIFSACRPRRTAGSVKSARGRL